MAPAPPARAERRAIVSESRVRVSDETEEVPVRDGEVGEADVVGEFDEPDESGAAVDGDSAAADDAAPIGASLARPELNTTDLLSGVQPSTRSGLGCHVSRLGSPPSAETTYTSALPAYSPLNATHLPSGENRGLPA